MNRISACPTFRLVFTSLLLVFATTCWADNSQDIFQSLGRQINTWVDDGSIGGAEVMVLERGKTVWHEAFGYRDLVSQEPMERNGVFRIRSMTKPILGTAALRLVASGKLSLDDSIAKYLPELRATYAEVTIRQLLTHTAGLEFSAFPRQRHNYSSLKESVIDAAKLGITRPAGEFLYSDLGSATLGTVLEAVSGTDLENLLQTEVFDVLSMHDSYTRFEPGASWAKRMNSTHNWNNEARLHERYWSPEEPQEMPYFRASGGVYSTVSDYAIFMEAWRTGVTASGERFLNDELMRLAHTRISDGPYGMHWEIETVEDSGEYIFGHGGSDGTFAVSVPDSELTLLYFTQSRGHDCRDQFAMLAGMSGKFGALNEIITWGRWRDRSASGQAEHFDVDDLTIYQGVFEANGEIIIVDQVDDRLKLIRGAAKSPYDLRPDGGWRSTRTVCRHFLAPPVDHVDLIPVGVHQFRMGKVVDGKPEEFYWPELTIDFRVQDSKAVGYEIEFEPEVRETARAFVWDLADPKMRKVTIAPDYMSAVSGTYESGTWGAAIRFENDALILDIGGNGRYFYHQGAGLFVNQEGDLLVVYRDLGGDSISLSILETGGYTHKLTKTSE